MKILFLTNYDRRLDDLWLLLFRIILAVFMLTHGSPKFTRLIEGNADGFPDPLGIGENMSLILAVFGEFAAPLLIIPGIMTRLAAIPVITAMTVAAFLVHAGDPFKSREMALLYLVGFLTILILGPGRYSLDHLISGKPDEK
jgi:putative oxidoreductase